jgi:hypothetical protein
MKFLCVKVIYGVSVTFFYILHCKFVYVYLGLVPHPAVFMTNLMIRGFYAQMYYIRIYVCM